MVLLLQLALAGMTRRGMYMRGIIRILCLLAVFGFLLSLNMAKSFAEGSGVTDWDREIISATGYGVGWPFPRRLDT